jgi:hypothetical protein
MSADDLSCGGETHRFRLTRPLSLRQEHDLRKECDVDVIHIVSTACSGRVLKVVLTENGAKTNDPLKGIRAFLAVRSLSFEYEYPARKAA